MRSFRLLFIALFFCSCNLERPQVVSTKQSLINAVRGRAVKRIYDEFHLIPFGTGAQAMDEIKMLYLAFRVPKTTTVEEARYLLITSVQIFVEEINKEKKIWPYLSRCPFTPQNVEVCLFIDSLTKEDLALASFRRGTLSYKRDVAHDQLMKTIFQESYEEAVQRVFLKTGFTKEPSFFKPT